MTRLMIRVEGEIVEELTNAFPTLTARTERPQSTLVGEVADQAELTGTLNLLRSLGIDVLQVTALPED